MKICLIIDDYLPSSIKVGAKMMHELGEEFVALGHTVTVITPDSRLYNRVNSPKNYEILTVSGHAICCFDASETTSEEKTSDQSSFAYRMKMLIDFLVKQRVKRKNYIGYAIDHLDGITICRFSSGEIKNTSKITRAINETLLPYYAWKFAQDYFKQHPQDLIIYYSPTIFWGHLVSRLKKLWHCKSYLILRDFFPQWVIDNGILHPYSPITHYFNFFEQLTYRAADRIGIQSPKNLAWFAKNKHANSPLEVLYNWAKDEPILDSDGYYRQELQLDNKVVFFYGGNIGIAQDMMNIVRLAKALLSEPKAHFVLVGAGDEVELVRNAIQQEALINMTLLPPVSQEEFKKMLMEFDVGLFSLHYNHTTHNFPGKLLGYMVQSKPILGSINPENDLQEVIETAGAGLISINGDDESLLKNALKLLHDDMYRQTMGKNGKQLLDDMFSVNHAAKQILNTLQP